MVWKHNVSLHGFWFLIRSALARPKNSYINCMCRAHKIKYHFCLVFVTHSSLISKHSPFFINHNCYYKYYCGTKMKDRLDLYHYQELLLIDGNRSTRIINSVLFCMWGNLLTSCCELNKHYMYEQTLEIVI